MNYDVYGIGNALVDMEYVVEDSYLQDYGITKGHMNLVDESRIEELTDSLEGLMQKRMCGGSAANTVYAVQGLGGATFYSCNVSGDEIGSYFISEMDAAGVHTNPQDPDMIGKSGRCLILITNDAERSMHSFLGVSHELGVDDINLEALKRSQYVYIEGYLASSNTAITAAVLAREAAQEADVLTSLVETHCITKTMTGSEYTFALSDVGRRFAREYRINLTFDGVASMTSTDTLSLWDIPQELVGMRAFESYQNLRPNF